MIKKIVVFIVLLISFVACSAFSKMKYSVDDAKCNSCYVCVGECPVGAINISGNKAEIDSSKCTSCGLCVDVCPKDAIR